MIIFYTIIYHEQVWQDPRLKADARRKELEEKTAARIKLMKKVFEGFENYSWTELSQEEKAAKDAALKKCEEDKTAAINKNKDNKKLISKAVVEEKNCRKKVEVKYQRGAHLDEPLTRFLNWSKDDAETYKLAAPRILKRAVAQLYLIQMYNCLLYTSDAADE